MDRLPLLVSSWRVRTGVFAGLASTMTVAAMVFRRIAREAREGACAAMVDGMEANCAMADGLGLVARGLGLGEIVVAWLALVSAFQCWRLSDERGRCAATGITRWI